jgi:sugar phosphate isomerase/epimerase
MDAMLRTVDACRLRGIRYVIHPVEYWLSELRPERRQTMMEDLRTMARHADLALIVHDEGLKGGKRLTREAAEAYREALLDLSKLSHVSIENATNSHDIKWFWQEHAASITLDIGHLELAGIDSIEFVKNLEPDFIDLIEFVHMHRVNGMRGGIRDHWGLTEDCRELRALKHLLGRKQGLKVILEVIEAEHVEKSLDLIQNLS